MQQTSDHTFHIPVMGLAYTIDSPIKVARFGISSVISIIEDRLVEMMRKHYYTSNLLEYIPISSHEEDYRAKRITDYLNLVNSIVRSQVEILRNERFDSGSEIVKYFEMLPDNSLLKAVYRKMPESQTQSEKDNIVAYLRTQIKPGSIDVNIMTKTDRNNFNKRGELLEDGSDAIAALRGFAESNLTNSSVIFSAGLNPRLYNYLEKCHCFNPDEKGEFSKKIIIKVSDYRSAIIQGKYLAKKGIWVSEFRIESGLNCGGHAFATEGFLLGPILEEFKSNKTELIDTLFEIYQAALLRKNGNMLSQAPGLQISVQGGIGNHEEDEFLRTYYNITSTGWGTPFLLVPEATTVDKPTLEKLSQAGTEDVILSRNSPLGVRFYYLKGTSSGIEKSLRIQNGKPGSPCTEKHLAFNTEFTPEPVCTASHKYQKLKVAELQSLNLPASEYQKQLKNVFDKECLCVGLSNSAAISYNQTFIKTLKAVTICPGPNIANFSQIVSLQTMTDHIYGRKNIITNNSRPHMFIAELDLYINFLREQIEEDIEAGQPEKKVKYITGFIQNLRNGINYYRQLSGLIKIEEATFITALLAAEKKLDFLNVNRFENHS